MTRAAKLVLTLLKINLQQELAYRADAFINILLNLMWLGWELLSLSIIFNSTNTLGGWGPPALIALLGVFRLMHTLMAAVIWPATEKFNTGVRDGTLDYTLLQPVNSLFLISFQRVVLWRVWELIISAVLIGVGVSLSGGTTWMHVIAFLLLVFSGGVILYSLWVVLIAFTFWFVKFDNNVTILQALLDTGRYPSNVYPVWLRMLVTFVVPIAVATTVPLQALRGELEVWQIIMFLIVSLASVVIASQVWKAGVRRYSGASS